ncbi:MAG: DUF4406 domain-containing protein [Methylotenera sp.]|nr:DUF4406 domain-containing protein [Flavobacterium sp.]
MKKIYIAGKVTGLPKDEVVEKFAAMQKKIENLGFEAVNPIEIVKDFNTPWNQAMRLCIAALTLCDAIVLLPDWINSNGAKIEWDISKQLKIPDFRGTDFGLVDLKAHLSKK